MKKVNSRMSRKYIWLSLVPLFCLGVVVTLFCAHTLYNNMIKEVYNGLKSSAVTVDSFYSIMDGDYYIINDNLYKGKENLSKNINVFDQLKEESNVDVTIFWGNTREITSITDAKGNRLVNTEADEDVVNTVLVNGGEYFSTRVKVGDTYYFGYYMPLVDNNGKIVGMIFAGKPCNEVRHSVFLAIIKIIGIAVISLLFATFFCINHSKRTVVSIEYIEKLMANIAIGNLHNELPKNLKERNDEFSDIGRSILIVQDSLEKLITTDPLTGLLNRRSATMELEKLVTGKTDNFCVVIGDIDYFKKVNDNYGHDCGDIVLCQISDILVKSVDDNGFVARWGGEEFLLVYKDNINNTVDKLTRLKDTISKSIIEYHESEIKVNMTFGVCENSTKVNINEMIKSADNNLYAGKTNGRNCIVY